MPTLNVDITDAVDSSFNTEPARIGLYVRDGNVYHVRIAKKDGGKHVYALLVGNLETGDVRKHKDENGRRKRVDGHAEGMAYSLKESERMTVGQVREYGHKFGICAWCGHDLKRDEWLLLGMGPVCFKNQMKRYDEQADQRKTSRRVERSKVGA